MTDGGSRVYIYGTDEFLKIVATCIAIGIIITVLLRIIFIIITGSCL